MKITIELEDDDKNQKMMVDFMVLKRVCECFLEKGK